MYQDGFSKIFLLITAGVKQFEYPSPIRLVLTIFWSAKSFNSLWAASSVSAAGRFSLSRKCIDPGIVLTRSSSNDLNPVSFNMT